MAYKNLLEWETTQIGVHNDPDGSNKYNEWFYGYRAKWPWCAVFQTRGFYEVGIEDRIKDLYGQAGCENWRKWAIRKGYWSTQPKEGSLVLFDWNPKAEDGADHIGIVESIFSGGVVTIEGNTGPDGASQTNGGWVLRKRRYNDKIMGYIHVDTNAVRPKPKPVIGFERYSGIDRYNTSKATANTFDDRNNAVVIVSGKSYADALSAAYFARQKKAPILLTAPEMIDDTVRYIRARSNIDTAYIVGGEAAVPAEIEEKLWGYKISRYAGTTRYGTNLAVLGASETPSKQLIVASGQNFPDGLCAGMVDRPTMLVHDKLKAEQAAYIKERGFDKFYVFGGEAAVSKEVARELSELGEVMRFAGDNRYATARAVAKTFFPLADTVVITTGKTFADGLSASNLGSYPLLLADPSNTIEARRLISKLNLKKVMVVGGKGAISDETVEWALTKLEEAQNV